MKKKHLLLTITLFTITTCLLAQNIEVAPIRLNFRGAPGDTETRIITVKNHGNSKENITMTMRDFIVHRHGNRETLPSGSTRNSISNWISLSPSFLELQPNESKEVQVTFQAPVEDDLGSKWGILSFATAVERTPYSADEEVQTGVFISGRIDVHLTFNPTTVREPNIVITNLRETTADDDVRVFEVNIDNLGSEITMCEVYLVAANLSTMEESKFHTQRITAYPQSSRTIELRLPDVLEKGKYSLAAILDYGSRSNLKGTQITIEVD